MHLTDFEADRLRNLKAVRLDLPAGLTVVTGRNAQGKTSLLEAVYLLATGRSFRTRRAEELIGWNGGPLRVGGRVSSRLGRSQLAVLMDAGSVRLLADGLETELDRYLGRLDVVDLTASRSQVLRGAPPERRRFLDRGIVGLRPELLRVLGDFRRALQQRNALLRGQSRRPGDARQLDAWDENLARAAAPLHEERRRYAVRLAAAIGPAEQALFPGGEQLRLSYRPSPEASGEAEPGLFQETFLERLTRGRSRDLAVGHTCTGPHRDELLLELNGVDLRRYGSAGQVRAAMIALKVGKLCLLREERGEAPLFLMDDFDSDLDEPRAQALAHFLRQGAFQVMAATSKETMADRLGGDSLRLRMEDGAARVA